MRQLTADARQECTLAGLKFDDFDEVTYSAKSQLEKISSCIHVAIPTLETRDYRVERDYVEVARVIGRLRELEMYLNGATTKDVNRAKPPVECIISHGNRQYSFDGIELFTVTLGENAVLQPFN